MTSPWRSHSDPARRGNQNPLRLRADPVGGPDETIKVPSVGDRPPRDLSRQSLAEVVEPRYDELFTLIQSELRRSGYEELIPAGVVLTGGTSKMEARWISQRRSSTCRSEWGHRNTRAACTTLSVIRFMPRRWVCPQWRRRDPGWRAGAAGRGVRRHQLRRSRESVVCAAFLNFQDNDFWQSSAVWSFLKKGENDV